MSFTPMKRISIHALCTSCVSCRRDPLEDREVFELFLRSSRVRLHKVGGLLHPWFESLYMHTVPLVYLVAVEILSKIRSLSELSLFERHSTWPHRLSRPDRRSWVEPFNWPILVRTPFVVVCFMCSLHAMMKLSKYAHYGLDSVLSFSAQSFAQHIWVGCLLRWLHVGHNWLTMKESTLRFDHHVV